MKKYQLFLVIISVFLSACSAAPGKPKLLSVGEYRLKLDMADDFYAEKNYPASLDVYREINQSFAKDTHVLFRLGNLYAQQGEPDKAIQFYQSALNEDKNLTKVWYNLAVIYMQQSVKTWQQMSNHADQTDPLYKAARYYNHGMLKLIEPRNK